MMLTSTSTAHVARYRVEVTLLPVVPQPMGRTLPRAGFVGVTGVEGLAQGADVRIDAVAPGYRSWSPPV